MQQTEKTRSKGSNLGNETKDLVERELEGSQRGFRNGHKIQDHVLTMQQTENNRRKASAPFLDLGKSFDITPYTITPERLHQRNINVKQGNSSSYTRKENVESKQFEIKEESDTTPTVTNRTIGNINNNISSHSLSCTQSLARVVLDDFMTPNDLAKSPEKWNAQLDKRNMTNKVPQKKIKKSTLK